MLDTMFLLVRPSNPIILQFPPYLSRTILFLASPPLYHPLATPALCPTFSTFSIHSSLICWRHNSSWRGSKQRILSLPLLSRDLPLFLLLLITITTMRTWSAYNHLRKSGGMYRYRLITKTGWLKIGDAVWHCLPKRSLSSLD